MNYEVQDPATEAAFQRKMERARMAGAGEIPPEDMPKPKAALPTLPDTDDVKKLAASMTPHVMKMLFEISLDEGVPANTRIQAAKEINDRGVGKAAGEVPTVAVQVNYGSISKADTARKLSFLDRVKEDRDSYES